MRIVAFDPGGTTGWAQWSGGGLDGFSLRKGGDGFDSGQMGGQEHHQELYDFLCFAQTHDFIVVTESFEYRQQQRPTVVLVSKEYIGVMKLFIARRKVKSPLVQQTAGKVKPFWTDDKLKKLGLWNGGHPHANDAMRHLLHYMTFDYLGGTSQHILRRLR
jgi:hypothetical protein